MKTLLRWILKIVGSAITLALVLVILPYLSRIASSIMPDESGAAIKASAIIATKLQDSARLETLRVEEEGVLNYDIQAAFIGSVGNVNVHYDYYASFGLDLSKVSMQVDGNVITFQLPAPELIQDTLTPIETYRDDFWYPGFSDDDYHALLEKERVARRDVYLTGDQADMLAQKSRLMFEETIAVWLENINGNLIINYTQDVDSLQ